MEGVPGRVRLRGVSPIMPVRRVSRSVDFYTGVLDFELADRNRQMTYAYVVRGDAGLMLLDLDEPQALQATARYLSAYIWVENVEGLWDSLEQGLMRLPEGRVTPLFRKPDRRHEFHVRDPDGFLLFFGTWPGA